MKLYLIRHGESENNKKGYYTGWAQVPLTEKGIEDAKTAGKFLSGITFNKIYSSDLIRAKKTAETALPGYTYEESSLLREIHLGELVGKAFSACTEEYGEELVKNRAISNYKPYGGENGEEFAGRVNAFLKKVSGESFETVAAFSHAGFLRKVLECVLQTKIPREFILCKNCTIAVFEYKDGKWYFDSWINTQ